MAPKKGFGPLTCVVSPDLSGDKNWYVVSHRICAMSLMQYLKKIIVVSMCLHSVCWPSYYGNIQVRMPSKRMEVFHD